MFSIEGKVAVITGGGSGIGYATVERFVKAKAKVVLADITDKTDMANELGCHFIQTDVTNEEQVEHLMRETAEKFGKIDIIINNAGIIMPEQLLGDANIDDYRRIYEINTYGVINGIKYGQKYMNDGGSIINTASNAADDGFPGYAAYGSSKAAVVEITRTAAVELAPRNIRVNCICPNTIDTPMAYAEGCETELKLVNVITPLARMCKPEECAALFHFLASDDCQYITGEDVYIDGGLKAGPSLQMIEKVVQD